MTVGSDCTGPRIYNLFPLLCGPIGGWHGFLPRIAAMGFDWVYVNPFHEPGFSGSLYAVKDYYRLNPLFRGEARQDDAVLLAAFVTAAKSHGLAVMMDLVVNHTAKDSVLAEQHPEWFAREPDGTIRSPHAIDPADKTKVTVWGDLGEIDYHPGRATDEIVAYWNGVVRHYLHLGFAGFRCDAAYKVPAEIWASLIAEARRTAPHALFCAETLGCQLDQVSSLANAGFDYLFNSVKWWDLAAPWALEQYEAFRHIAPSIGFPESHDTERLAKAMPTDIGSPDDARRFYLLRYALAACFGSGVLMPIGYEFGFRRRLDVVKTRPSDWEEPWFDLSDDIAAINAIKRDSPALNEEGPQQALVAQDELIGLLRLTNDGKHASLFLANARRSGGATIDLSRLMAETGIDSRTLIDTKLGTHLGAGNSALHLAPLEWRLLRTP